MPFVAALFLGVAVGLLRGGHIQTLAHLRFRAPVLLAFSLLLWLAVSPTLLQRWLHTTGIAPLLLLLAYVLLLTFIWLNREIPWLVLVGCGLLGNFVTMVVNGGHMPVDQTLLDTLSRSVPSQGASDLWLHFRPITGETIFPFLGDTILLGPPFPWPCILSPGDVLIALGGLLVVASAMCRRNSRRQSVTTASS